MWAAGGAGGYLGFRELITIYGGEERTLTMQPTGRFLSSAAQDRRRRDFWLGMAGGGFGGGLGFRMGLRTLSTNSAALGGEVLAAIRNPTFLDRAAARGATPEQLAALAVRIEEMMAQGAVVECLSGGEATLTNFSIGRLNLLSSRRSRIFHELGHMLDDVMRPGLLAEAGQMGPAFGYGNYYQAEAMAYYMQQGFNFWPQTGFNAFMQTYPNAGSGGMFLGILGIGAYAGNGR